jgi:hypothetical protein
MTHVIALRQREASVWELAGSGRSADTQNSTLAQTLKTELSSINATDVRKRW